MHSPLLVKVSRGSRSAIHLPLSKTEISVSSLYTSSSIAMHAKAPALSSLYDRREVWVSPGAALIP